MIHLSSSAQDFKPFSSRLAETVRGEMSAWSIGGVSIALISGQDIIHQEAFGEAKPDSAFRVGSISKLFTAIGVMQLVEAGKMQLDDPISEEVLPWNPYPQHPPVTLRQLLSHRSGIQREPTVGGYLDGSQPGLNATVQSSRSCVLTLVPGEKTHYSNLGPSIAGYWIQEVAQMPFESYQQSRLLEPLGMKDSFWRSGITTRNRVLTGHMRVTDSHGGWTRRVAPAFELGTIPAGNLYSTAEDLARFASALLRGGSPILQPTSLEEMWRALPNNIRTGAVNYGLGFQLGTFQNHRTVGHTGSVYGFTSSLLVLPDDQLAVVVLANEDLVSGRVRTMSETALSLLLEWKNGVPSIQTQISSGGANLNPLVGDFESPSLWAHFAMQGGKLKGEISGQEVIVESNGADLATVESRWHHQARLEIRKQPNGRVSGFLLDGEEFVRVAPDVGQMPQPWWRLLGSYGPEWAPIVITERHGHLYAMTENLLDYRLTPVNRNVCAISAGLYADEQLIFLTDANDEVKAINFANMILSRRKVR